MSNTLRQSNKAVLLALMLALAPAASYAQSVGIAAVVNEQVITTTDVTDRMDFIIATTELKATPEVQAKLRPRIIDALINETLELEEAKRLSIDITDAEIDAAIGKLEQARHRPPGSLRTFITENNLSYATLEKQLRAQLAWSKVVQRKLRRSVFIADDEVARAQQAQAAAPGTKELRIAAISLPITDPSQEADVAAQAADLSEKLNNGADFLSLAQDASAGGKAVLNAPVWVPEEGLQPVMQQALRTLQPGQVTQPLRTQNSYQLVSLLDRRTSKATPDNTEVVLKQYTIVMPAQRDKESILRLRALSDAIRANPGSCIDDVAPPEAKVEYLHAKYGQMTPDLRSVVEHLGVTEISEPLLTPDKILLVMPCERTEPAVGLPDATKVKNELYSEKLELEAQKYLRNLRRDAFVDIKGQ